MKKVFEFLKSNAKWNMFLWIFMGVFVFFSLLAVQSKEDELNVSSIQVIIEPEEDLAFLDSMKVLEIIKGTDSTLNLNGISAGGIDIFEMEAALEHYPFIEKADVSIDLGGSLIVKVLQRNPVLRIFCNKGQSYYVSKNGFKMPLHPGFTPRVLTASGEIAESLTDSAFLGSPEALNLLRIANYCISDPFWHAQIEQLYVDNYKDIILIPKVGNHSIVFGSADKTEEKFKLLKTFYRKGLNASGWDQYRKIDLRYEGQIVAEKKQSEIITQATQP